MKIACIGGGPAGLYLGILVKRAAPQHDVVVYERNRPTDTFGFGVVFSDATLGNLEAADPETHAEITSHFARWDDIEIHTGGEVLRSTGHGFCGLERKTLLQILQSRAAALGVQVHYEHELGSLDAPELASPRPDLIVACDGVGSWVRDALAADFQPDVDVRPNKFVWLGCTVPYGAFTFIFKPSRFGLFRVHAYRYHQDGSTFIVECREDTWRAAGLAEADEDTTVRILGEIFADELAGHSLVKNRSIWRNFPTVRCGSWHAPARGARPPVVLMGDAAHTAHFSIGSGTKLAMEDAIVLRDELLAKHASVTEALAAYEKHRRPDVLALQAAAQASLEWFEGTERYMEMAPIQLTYSLMTRSLRVSHASVAKRDPHLARGVEQLLATQQGLTGEPPAPTEIPLTVGDRRLRSRIAIAPSDGNTPAAIEARLQGIADASHTDVVRTDAVPAPLPSEDTVPHAAGGPANPARPDDARFAHAGLVLAGPIAAADIANDPQGWSSCVRTAHARDVRLAVRLIVPAFRGAPDEAFGAAIDALLEHDVDLVVLDAEPPAAGTPTSPAASESLPAAVQFASGRETDRTDWLGAVVVDRPATRGAVLAHAAQLTRAGASHLWVFAGPDADDSARMPAAPLADRLRNELEVPTFVDGSGAALPDLEAAIAAGRADAVIATPA